MIRKITIVKVGGAVVEDEAQLSRLLQDFCAIDGPKILVHGGGVMANQTLRRLGIEPKMVDGRRITDAETLKVAVSVYAGWLNKTIVAKLQARGCNAVGLSGADGGVIESVIRPKEPVEYGFVGDVTLI